MENENEENVSALKASNLRTRMKTLNDVIELLHESTAEDRVSILQSALHLCIDELHRKHMKDRGDQGPPFGGPPGPGMGPFLIG